MMKDVEYIIDFDELRLGTIAFKYDDTLDVHSSKYSTKETLHKAAVLCTTEVANLSHRMHGLHAVRHFPYAASNLYVSSDVKVPREIYRKSGYGLKRDPDSADYTVLPWLEAHLPRFYYDVVVYNPDRKILYLFTLPKSDEETYKLSDVQIEAIQTRFGSMQLSANNIGPHWAYMLPKCQEYFDLIQNTYPSRCYTFEEEVKLSNLPVTISAETLLLWEKIDDYNLLRKTILNSDWRDYPVTLCAFLMANHKRINNCNDTAFKNVMRQIRYDNTFSMEELVKGTDVEPKDWNLLQEYILKKMGVHGDKGFVSFESYMKAKDLRRFLPRRIAVSAMKISQSVLTDNLLEILGSDIPDPDRYWKQFQNT